MLTLQGYQTANVNEKANIIMGYSPDGLYSKTVDIQCSSLSIQ